MNLTEARQALNAINFRYVEEKLPMNNGDFKTYYLDESAFYAVLPRISCFGVKHSLSETVEYLLSREAELVRLYEDYNSDPYCPTWFHPIGQKELTVGYKTSSGTIIEATFRENGENSYSIEIPIARADGFHDLMVRMAKAGATPELFEIKNNFYRVTEEEYRVYTPWWNSTGLGELLPTWEEYDRQQKEADALRETERLAQVEQQKLDGKWYDGDIDYEVDDIA